MPVSCITMQLSKLLRSLPARCCVTVRCTSRLPRPRRLHNIPGTVWPFLVNVLLHVFIVLVCMGTMGVLCYGLYIGLVSARRLGAYVYSYAYIYMGPWWCWFAFDLFSCCLLLVEKKCSRTTVVVSTVSSVIRVCFDALLVVSFRGREDFLPEHTPRARWEDLPAEPSLPVSKVLYHPRLFGCVDWVLPEQWENRQSLGVQCVLKRVCCRLVCVRCTYLLPKGTPYIYIWTHA